MLCLSREIAIDGCKISSFIKFCGFNKSFIQTRHQSSLKENSLFVRVAYLALGAEKFSFVFPTPKISLVIKWKLRFRSLPLPLLFKLTFQQHFSYITCMDAYMLAL